MWNRSAGRRVERGVHIGMIVNTTAISVLMLAVTASAPAAMTDAEARKVIADFTESFVKAEKAGDAAGVSQHFAKDSIRVGPNGIIHGWDAISKNYSEIYKVFKEKEDTVEVVKAVDNCAILVSGKWSGVRVVQRCETASILSSRPRPARLAR